MRVERLQSLLNDASDAFQVISPDGRFLYTNQAWRQMLGYSEAEIEHLFFFDLVHPDSRDRCLETFQAIQLEEDCNLQISLIAKDGRTFAVKGYLSYHAENVAPPAIWSRWQRLPDPLSASVASQPVVSVEPTIPGQKRIKEVLHQSEEKFRQLAEHIRDLFWMCDPATGQFLYVNPTCEKVWGCSQERFYEKPLTLLEITHPDDKHLIRVAMQQEQQGKEVDIEYRIIHPNGETRWVHDRSFPLHNQAGQVYCIAGITEDITERKQAELELQQLNQELEQRVQQRTAELQQQNLRSQLLADIILKIRESLELDEILQTTVSEVRHLLQADRVLIYQLYPDGSGIVISESVAPNQVSVMTRKFTDHCFGSEYRRTHQQGRVYSLADVETDGIASCLVEFLYQFNVKAKLVVPILLKETLMGLLIVHQCDRPRQWSDFEIELLQQLSNHVSIALSQSQNVKALRSSEERYRSSERRYRRMIETTLEGVWVMDADGTITFANQQIASMLGYTQEEVVGKQLFAFMDEEWQAIAAKNLQRRQHGIKEQLDFKLCRQDGSDLWVLVSANPIFDASDQFIGALAMMTDISDRKKAESEILKTLEKERELSELKSRFISMVSHEFRTPLTTIQSAAELLEYYEWSGEERQERFQQIRDAVTHMIQLMEDVLLIGRVEAGRLRPRPEPLDLRKVCQEVAAEIQLLDHLNQSISLVRRGKPRIAWLDRKLIRLILQHLLSNAIKYSPNGGNIELRLLYFEDKEEVVIRVQDEGIGIPLQDRERLFEPFHRAANVGTIQGTGLGLAIVKHCVNLHGGQITVESELGSGTTFSIILPLHPLKRQRQKKTEIV
jgi:PAS domain S-box-containing protein